MTVNQGKLRKFFNRLVLAAVAVPMAALGPEAIASGADGGMVLDRLYSGSGAGACESQGALTAQAFERAKELYSVLEKLKNDPACGAIKDLSTGFSQAHQELARLRQVHNESQSLEGSYKLSNLSSEIGTLYEYLRRDHVATPANAELRRDAQRTMVRKLLDLASRKIGGERSSGSPEAQESWNAMKNRARYGAIAGLTYLDNALNVLPNLQQCLAERPNENLVVMGAAVGLLGAFASSEEGVISKLGQTLLSVANFIRNTKFAGTQAKLKQLEYWNSLSCLVETSAEAYCSNKDGHRIHKYFSDAELEKELSKKYMPRDANGMTESKVHDSPLYGYFLLQRELAAVSNWIFHIQMGSDPKLSVETNFRNNTLSTMHTLLTSIFEAKGMFSEKLVIINDAPHAAKMNYLRELVTGLVSRLGRATGFQNSEVNFFTQVKNVEEMPYWLIGLDKIPSETLPDLTQKDPTVLTNRVPISFDYWALNGGAYQPMFHNPEKLIVTIRERLWRLLDDSMTLGSRYFRKFFNPDAAFLGAMAAQDPNLTVRYSIQSLQAYLVRLYNRLSQDTKRHAFVLPAIADTIHKLNRVRTAFIEVDKVGKEIAALRKDPKEDIRLTISKVDPAKKKKWDDAYKDLLSEAYQQFNILLQRDTFLTQRFSSFVLYDFGDRLMRKENIDPYLEDLLRVAGRNMHDRMFEFTNANPTSVYTDLNNATAYVRKTLETLDGWLTTDRNEWKSMLKEFKNYADTKDTPERVFDQVRARLCIQSLVFDNWRQYYPYCKGAVLFYRPDQAYFDAAPKGIVPQEQDKGWMSRMKSVFNRWWQPVGNERKAGANVVKKPVVINSSPNMTTQNYSTDRLFNLSYNRLVIERKDHDRSNDKVRDGQICLMRDFHRRAKVYWMTKRFATDTETNDDAFAEVAKSEAATFELERQLEEANRKSMREQELNKLKEREQRGGGGGALPDLDVGGGAAAPASKK